MRLAPIQTPGFKASSISLEAWEKPGGTVDTFGLPVGGEIGPGLARLPKISSSRAVSVSLLLNSSASNLLSIVGKNILEALIPGRLDRQVEPGMQQNAALARFCKKSSHKMVQSNVCAKSTISHSI